VITSATFRNVVIAFVLTAAALVSLHGILG